jgi:tRNA(Ile)-lysidine synthase
MAETTGLASRVAQCLATLDGAGLVVAVSGGPDSVALLRAAAEARGPAATGPLVLAHLDHQLRGPASTADAQFVTELHAALEKAGVPGVRLCMERIDMATLAQREGANLEALARRERYRWLAEVARREGVRWVATGHTANDQAETVLHRLLRGTGLRGLRGIAARRPLTERVSVVRPLLQTTRAEVLDYLAAIGQSFREDESNRDLRWTRNRIRHELLPLLARTYNPAIVAVLGRLAAQAEEIFALQEQEARALLQEAEKPRAAARCVFDRDPLAAAPRHRLREALRLVWEREGWPVSEMSFAAWDRLAGVARGEAAAVDLPGGIRARCRGRVLLVGPSELQTGRRPG